MSEILLFRTALPASADAVWAAVKAPATFGFVARGWMRYRRRWRQLAPVLAAIDSDPR